MRAAVISFPGSNRETDACYALQQAGFETRVISSRTTTDFTDYGLIMLPGGFSFGDYLRCGAMAAKLPIMQDIRRAADQGVFVLGVCNGFQILTEAGLLPGALRQNARQHFVCRQVSLRVCNNQSPFSHTFGESQIIRIPVAHHEGNYLVDQDTLAQLNKENRIILRYAADDNPNGSTDDIAGIINARGNVLGMMPHPENATLPHHFNQDGLPLFTAIAQRVTA